MSPGETPRSACALQGAVATSTAIGGVIPIVHATAGCALQCYLSNCLASSTQGYGHIGGLSLPSTNITEKHVIFGGSSRLREQIKNTVRILDGELYFVLSGCAPDLVGDDSKAMTEEIREQGYPAVYLQTPGFLGNAYLGYQSTVKTIIDFIIDQTTTKPSKTKGLVNVFGIVPGQDSFWQGDLLQLGKILSSVGLTPNTLLGAGQTMENWKQIPEAELNLVFSPWGQDIAMYLEDRYETPYIGRIYIPIGLDEIEVLLKEISQKINVNKQLIEKSINNASTEFNFVLGQFADAYFNYDFQVDFSVIGPTSQVLGISHFLMNTLGLNPKALVITDNPPLKDVEIIKHFLPEIDGKIGVLFSDDSQEIAIFLNQERVTLILGSTLEKDVAAKSGSAYLSISNPLWDRIILHRGYLGYEGGLNLIEDVGTALLRARHQLDYLNQPKFFDERTIGLEK